MGVYNLDREEVRDAIYFKTGEYPTNLQYLNQGENGVRFKFVDSKGRTKVAEIDNLDFPSSIARIFRESVLIKILLVICIGSFVFAGATKIYNVHKTRSNYNKAVKAYEIGINNYESEKLDEARTLFCKNPEYKNSSEYIEVIDGELEVLSAYNHAVDLYNENDYENAFCAFKELGDYRDSKTYINTMSKAIYDEAIQHKNAGELDEAESLLMMLPDYTTEYNDASSALEEIAALKLEIYINDTYSNAVISFDNGDTDTAQKLFLEISDYVGVSDYLDMLGNYYFTLAQECWNDGKYEECMAALDHIDSSSEWYRYNEAVEYRKNIIDGYKNYVETEAVNILHTQGYEAFNTFVENSVNCIYSSGDANSLKSKYKPVFLGDLTSYSTGEWQAAPYLAAISWSNKDLYFADQIVDETGVSHDNCMLGGGCYASYHIGGNYSYLQGCLFVIKGQQATDDEPVFILIRDGDGNDLFTYNVMSGYGPVYFSVDVRGIQDITIYFDGFFGDDWDQIQFGGCGEMCLIP